MWAALCAVMLSAGLVYWCFFHTPSVNSDEELTKFVNERMDKVLKHEVYRKIDDDSKTKRELMEYWKGLPESLKASDDDDIWGTIILVTAMGNEKALKFLFSKPAFRSCWEGHKKEVASQMAHIAGVTGNRKIISFLTDEMKVPMRDLLPGLKGAVLDGGQKDYCAELVKEYGMKYNELDLTPVLTRNMDSISATAALMHVLKDPGSSVKKSEIEHNIVETFKFILAENCIEGKHLDKEMLASPMMYCHEPKIKKPLEAYLKKHGYVGKANNVDKANNRFRPYTPPVY